MTVETKPDLTPIATTSWSPSGRRQGERSDWGMQPETHAEANEKLALPMMPPAPVRWPRVFPGL